MLKTRSVATLLGAINANWSSAMRKDRNEKLLLINNIQ